MHQHSFRPKLLFSSQPYPASSAQRYSTFYIIEIVKLTKMDFYFIFWLYFTPVSFSPQGNGLLSVRTGDGRQIQKIWLLCPASRWPLICFLLPINKSVLKYHCVIIQRSGAPQRERGWDMHYSPAPHPLSASKCKAYITPAACSNKKWRGAVRSLP